MSVVAVLLLVPARAAAVVVEGDPVPPASVRWTGPLAAPVAGPVVARFHAPTTYGPGHRGVDLAVAIGTPVGAAAPGTVTFAGEVAGRRWVTVDHGWLRTTVGPLERVRVRSGWQVGAGAVLGTSGRAHGRPGLHVSARIGGRYVDPLAPPLPRASLVPVVGAWRTPSG